MCMQAAETDGAEQRESTVPGTEYSLSLQLSCLLRLAIERLRWSWSTFSWAQGHFISINRVKESRNCVITLWPWSRSKLKGRERREGNDGELRLMMSHYWQAVRNRERMMNWGSNEDGEERREKMRWIKERGQKERQVKKTRRWASISDLWQSKSVGVSPALPWVRALLEH